MFRFLFYERRFDQFPVTVAEKIVHRLGIILVIEPTNEVDRVAALLLVLIEPQVSAYGDLLAAVVPFVL